MATMNASLPADMIGFIDGVVPRGGYANVAFPSSAETGIGWALQCDEIAMGVQLFHLDHVARRRGITAHCLYFKTATSGPNHTIILRVLLRDPKFCL